MSPIVLSLWMDLRIAVDFTGRCLEYLGPRPLGEAEHIDSAMHTGFGRLDRIVLVVDRRCGTGQVIYFIYFNVQWKRHVMAHQFEIGFVQQISYVVLRPGKQIVHTDQVMSLLHQAPTEMGAQKSGAACNQDPLSQMHSLVIVLVDPGCCGKYLLNFE